MTNHSSSVRMVGSAMAYYKYDGFEHFLYHFLNDRKVSSFEYFESKDCNTNIYHYQAMSKLLVVVFIFLLIVFTFEVLLQKGRCSCCASHEGLTQESTAPLNTPDKPSPPEKPANPMDRLKNAMSQNQGVINQLKTPEVAKVASCCDLSKIEAQLTLLNETLKSMLSSTQEYNDQMGEGALSPEEEKAEEDAQLEEMGGKIFN